MHWNCFARGCSSNKRNRPTQIWGYSGSGRLRRGRYCRQFSPNSDQYCILETPKRIEGVEYCCQAHWKSSRPDAEIRLTSHAEKSFPAGTVVTISAVGLYFKARGAGGLLKRFTSCHELTRLDQRMIALIYTPYLTCW